MSFENNKIQVDIENLFKQNVNDLSAIKELYRKLKEIENKITQIKYIDSNLANKLKKEYEKLKRIILDENVSATLSNEIETINEKLTNEIETVNEKLTNEIETVNENLNNEIETINSQLDTNVKEINKKIDDIVYLIDNFPKEKNDLSDSERIQRAIDFVNSVGGGTVHFPQGSYIIGKTIILKDLVSLVGVGNIDFRGIQQPSVTEFIESDSFDVSSGTVFLEHEYTGTQGYRNNLIKNIAFKGRYSTPQRTKTGIKTKHMGVLIQNCSFTLLDIGVYLASSANNVVDCFGGSCNTTIFIGGTENIVTNLHDWARINSFVVKGDGNRIFNCKIFGDGSGASEYAIVNSGNRNMFINNYIDKYKFGAMLFRCEGKNIYGCNISHNYMYDNGTGDTSTPLKSTSIIFQTAKVGYKIFDNIIESNIIQTDFVGDVANVQNGLYFYADNDTQIFDNVISNNIISDDIPNKVKNVGTDFTKSMILNNKNFKTQNSGVSSVANGETINHGLSVKPKTIIVTGTNSRRCINVTNITNTTFTVSMINTSDNTLISEKENVNWIAIY